MPEETLSIKVKDTVKVEDKSAVVNLSPELYELLTDLASETGETAAEVLRKAIVLMDAAVEAVRTGGTVTINEASAPGAPLRVKEITGLYERKHDKNEQTFTYEKR